MKRITTTLLALLLLIAPLHAEEELLPAHKAFAISVEAVDGQTVKATWTIANGYYLYGSKFRFESESDGITLGKAQLPPGKIKHDEFFGDVEIYRGSVSAVIPVTRAANSGNTVVLKTTSQGCADIGVCYPPLKQTNEIKLAAATINPAFSSDSGNPLESDKDDILEADQAFRFDSLVLDGNTLMVRWEIEPGYYLYKGKFSFELLDADGVGLGQPRLPAGEVKDDEFFGKIEVYHNLIEARLPLQRTNLDPVSVKLMVGYQGCAEVGICYPPQKKTVSLDLPAGNTGSAPTATTEPPTAAIPLSEQDRLAAALAGENTFGTILLFFIAGLLLAFTPCVFPMIPILSSIIVGQGESITTRKAFVLSLTYVLAMAFTYTVAGIIAGVFGSNLQAAFQNPWILGGFATIFVALAFSMFGFYELQLPSAIQSKLTEVSNRQQGGSLAGVAIMGLLSALIVGPCVAPPLMGALIYIGQTGDPWLGGLALFALSMGMGAPLVAIGTAGGKFLPRAGGWMDTVKAVFGVLLLAVAVWMLERILPAEIAMLLWALLVIGSAIYMGALSSLPEDANGWRKLWKMLSLVMLLQGALMLIGLAAGNTDPLQPLKGIGFADTAAAKPAHLAFKKVTTVEELDREVAAAAAKGQSVMLDFYADWCVSCKEFEKYTFSDPQVLAALNNSVALQADVTANNDADQALLKRFGLIGPPGIIFYDQRGNELKRHRVVGFMDAPEFASHINNALGK